MIWVYSDRRDVCCLLKNIIKSVFAQVCKFLPKLEKSWETTKQDVDPENAEVKKPCSKLFDKRKTFKIL